MMNGALVCGLFYYASAQDLYDHTRSLRYAEYLFTSHEYGLAAQEYERMAFLDSTNAAIRLRLLQAYRLGKQYPEAIGRIQRYYPADKNTLPSPFAIEYGKLLLQSNRVLQATTFIRGASSLPDSVRLVMTISAALLAGNWRVADTLLHTANMPDTPVIRRYQSIVAEAASQPYKRPILAASMSAIVPGSGKVYAGAWKDGLFSVLLIGVTTWQAYRAFDKSGISSGYGWAYGGMAAGFYLGNIWGAAKAARVRNTRFKTQIIRQTNDAMDTLW